MRVLVCSLVLAFGVGAFSAYAEETAPPTTKPAFKEGSCCDKAAKAGKDCTHPCCAAAIKDGKACAKCNPPAAKE